MEQHKEHISDQHLTDTQTKPQTSASKATKPAKPAKPAKPVGEVMVPAFSCGVAGALLAIILAKIGWYDGMDQSLKAYYMGKPFYMVESSASALQALWDGLIVTLLSFGVSFAVLDTDKQWRRVMMIFMLTVVVIFSSPVLMLWDVFWSPVTVLIGVLWSWMCAFIYSCQHTMPCEVLLEKKEMIEDQVKPEIALPTENEDLSDKKYQPKQASSCPD